MYRSWKLMENIAGQNILRNRGKRRGRALADEEHLDFSDIQYFPDAAHLRSLCDALTFSRDSWL